MNDRPAMVSDVERIVERIVAHLRDELRADLSGDIARNATQLRAELRAELRADLSGDMARNATQLRAELRADLNTDMARMIKASNEEFRDWARSLHDETKAVVDRQDVLAAEVATQRANLDAHRADAIVHRIPKRTRRR